MFIVNAYCKSGTVCRRGTARCFIRRCHGNVGRIFWSDWYVSVQYKGALRVCYKLWPTLFLVMRLDFAIQKLDYLFIFAIHVETNMLE